MKTVKVEHLRVIPHPSEAEAFIVSSGTKEGVAYTVRPQGDTLICNCMAGDGGRECKHRKAVRDIGNAKEKEGALKPEQGRTVKGYVFGEVASAYQKEIRRSDEAAALFWGMELYDTSMWYFWKRTLVIAAEDVGFGDPQAVRDVILLQQAWDMVKKVSKFVDPQHVVMAILTLARATKSTEVDDAKNLTQLRRKAGLRLEVPEYALDCHTAAGKEAGKTVSDWYADRNEVIGTNPFREMLTAEFDEFVNGPRRMM